MKDLCLRIVLCQGCPFKLLYHNPHAKSAQKCFNGKFRHNGRRTIPEWGKVMEVAQ